MVAYTNPQQWKKEESKQLRGERDKIKFIDLRFERGHILRFGKEEEGKPFHKLHVIWVNDDWWDSNSTRSRISATGRY